MQYTDQDVEKYVSLIASIIADEAGGIARFQRTIAPGWAYSAHSMAQALGERYEDHELEKLGLVWENSRWIAGEVILHSPVSLAARLNRPALIRRLCETPIFTANSSLGCIFNDDAENDGYETVDDASPLTVAIDSRNVEAIACLLDLDAHVDLGWSCLVETDSEVANEVLAGLLNVQSRAALKNASVIDQFVAGLLQLRQRRTGDGDDSNEGTQPNDKQA